MMDLDEEAAEGGHHPERQFPVARGIWDDFIEDDLGDFGEKYDGNRHQGRAKELSGCEAGVAAQVGENTEDGIHFGGQSMGQRPYFVK